MDRETVNRKKLAERIAALLSEKGWSQTMLAEKSGMYTPRINVILKGKENLTIDTITALEIAFGEKIIKIF